MGVPRESLSGQRSRSGSALEKSGLHVAGRSVDCEFQASPQEMSASSDGQAWPLLSRKVSIGGVRDVVEQS